MTVLANRHTIARRAVFANFGASVDDGMRASVRSAADERLYRAHGHRSHTNLTEFADAHTGPNVMPTMNDGECCDLNAGAYPGSLVNPGVVTGERVVGTFVELPLQGHLTT
jgi:hypothetical protein